MKYLFISLLLFINLSFSFCQNKITGTEKIVQTKEDSNKIDDLKSPFSMTQEEIDEKQRGIVDPLDITGVGIGSGETASFPEKYREMANEYNLTPFTPPSQEELDKMLLIYRLKKYGKWAIIPILILGVYYLRSSKKNKDRQSETLHLKERYKELIRAFDEYDLYNKPIVLIDELNMFKMAWVGQTIKSDFWLNEVNRTLIVKYTLEYNAEALSKNGIKVEELPVINQELNWKFDIDKMGQIQMYSIISTDLKTKMDKV